MSDYAVKKEVVAAVVDAYRTQGRDEAFEVLKSQVTGLQDNEVSELLQMILISHPNTRQAQKGYYRASRSTSA